VRRRRLPTKRGTTSLVAREQTTDFKYLEQVVTIQFPVQAAREYLQRNMANRVSYRLVEAERGEAVGMVRSVEIRHENSGQKTLIHGQRVLANGQPASFFVPDHLVRIVPRVEGLGANGRSLGQADEIVLHVPVRGYLRFLPELFHGEGPVQSRELTRVRDTALQRWGGGLPEEAYQITEVNEDPLRRFLFTFQHLMTTVTDRIDRIVDLTDPMACDPKFLPWLASWVGFELDESLPINQQRELVRRAIRLYRARGTRGGIEEMIRVLTSAPVRVRERELPKAAVVGQCTLIGGRDIVERYERDEPPGHYLMDPYKRRKTSFFVLVLEPRERFMTRFGERAAPALRRIVQVVSQERPTHVAFTVEFDARRR
jgi:phage tail-like protein